MLWPTQSKGFPGGSESKASARDGSKFNAQVWTDHQPRLDAWDKCSDLVHWEDPEVSGEEGGGRGDRDGEYMYIQGWFMSMYVKNHYNIVK